MQPHVERFLSQIDDAGAGNVGVVGIEDHRLTRGDSILHRKRRSRAAHIGLAIAAGEELERLAAIQTKQLDDQVRHAAAGHGQADLPGRSGEHLGHRDPAAGELEAATNHAGAVLHLLHLGKQAVQASVLQPHRGIGLDRLLAGIELQRGIDRAARHAETQRVEREDAVRKLQVGGEIVERQRIGPPQLFRVEHDVGIDPVHPLDVERLARQRAIAFRRFRLGLTGCLRARLFGLCLGLADHRSEILQIEHAALEFRLQQRPVPGLVVAERAGEVARAHLAFEVFVERVAARALQAPFDAVRRGFR